MAPRLTDLLPALTLGETVDVLGMPIECRPLKLSELASLLLRFKNAVRLTKDEKGAATVRLDAGTIAALGPEALAAVLAAGTGSPGDPEQEAAAAALPPGVQTRLFGTILRLSAPEGIIPFIRDLVALMGGRLDPEAEAVIGQMAIAA